MIIRSVGIPKKITDEFKVEYLNVTRTLSLIFAPNAGLKMLFPIPPKHSFVMKMAKNDPTPIC
ncbi:MAG: hypothetical protein AUJ18_10385 [Candidatus Hydrogenedentes bacterium CG1_02_42_14]|nr:MAG: hypothetical protein AUJ18_10385 [Candidatus Hydrogenedentes bacterium CG1_02_42_14]